MSKTEMEAEKKAFEIADAENLSRNDKVCLVKALIMSAYHKGRAEAFEEQRASIEKQMMNEIKKL